jgi:hypothetical protein
VRYGVGAGATFGTSSNGTTGQQRGGDLKPRVQLPICVERFYRFFRLETACLHCLWKIAWHGSFFFSGDEAVSEWIYGLQQVEDDERCFEIFRHEQTLVVHGLGDRTPVNTEVAVFDTFEYVDIFSLVHDGRPTHQDRFYLPRQIVPC